MAKPSRGARGPAERLCGPRTQRHDRARGGRRAAFEAEPAPAPRGL